MKENIKTKDATKREIIGSAQNKTRQTHLGATLICPTKCIIKAIDATKKKLSGKETVPYQIMRKINSKVADNIV